MKKLIYDQTTHPPHKKSGKYFFPRKNKNNLFYLADRPGLPGGSYSVLRGEDNRMVPRF